MHIALILNRIKQYDGFALGIKQRHQLLCQHTRRVTALTFVLMQVADQYPTVCEVYLL